MSEQTRQCVTAGPGREWRVGLDCHREHSSCFRFRAQLPKQSAGEVCVWIHHPFPLACEIPVLCPQQLCVKDVTDLVRKLKFSRNRKFSRFQALGILGFSGIQRCNLSARCVNVLYVAGLVGKPINLPFFPLLTD